MAGGGVYTCRTIIDDDGIATTCNVDGVCVADATCGVGDWIRFGLNVCRRFFKIDLGFSVPPNVRRRLTKFDFRLIIIRSNV